MVKSYLEQEVKESDIQKWHVKESGIDWYLENAYLHLSLFEFVQD